MGQIAVAREERGERVPFGGPIALVEGDTIVADLNADRIDCLKLNHAEVRSCRFAAWEVAADANGGVRPDARPVDGRMLRRMRATARPALLGGGMSAP